MELFHTVRPSGAGAEPAQWVRGERFYGRDKLITEILDGHRNSIWVLGTRRVGKTSLLKQLEDITAPGDREFLPIFWDFQGADNSEELNLTFKDALLDAEDRLEEIGIELDSLNGDLFATLAKIRRKARSKGRTLLLLCDEVEELLNLHRKDPALLRKLRRAMQSQEGVRSVLASSVRLCALAEQRGDTSPFLHGFSPPLYIDGLSEDEARSLIIQDHLPPDSRPAVGAEDADTIRRRCDHHPYLIQLICKRYLELGDLDEACEQVAVDRMVSYFFSVDFEMLSDTERTVLRLIAERDSATSKSIENVLQTDTAGRAEALQRLHNLGFIRRNEERGFVLSSFFLRRWLEDLINVGVTQETRAALSETDESTLRVAGKDNTQTNATIDGRYRLQKEIGAGATGTVYKAWDELLQTWVAVKLLRPEYTANPEALERVRQEIILSRDIGHPNILRIYHLGAFKGGTYLTMQWIDGTTLADVISKKGALPADQVLDITAKLVSALGAAHNRQILHRDIKPGNILLDDEGEPYLADFGIARLIGQAGITRHDVFLGTPQYSSPEQANMKPLDERSDLYALGLVVYEMTTGRRPFEADNVQELLEMQRNTKPPDPRTVVPKVPPSLSKLILRCLEKKPAKRFSDTEAMGLALQAVARDLS